MKKILIAEKSSKFVNLSEIHAESLVVGINRRDSSMYCGEINIVAETDRLKYKLISIQDYIAWRWEEYETIQELIEQYKNRFDFYLLDDWAEIKEFIR